MRSFFYTFLCLMAMDGLRAQAADDTLRVVAYNLLNFPEGRNDCGSNVVVPARWDTLRNIVDYLRPDVLMICELQTEAGADSILRRALNVGGKTSYRRANFVPNRSTFLKNLNNMLFYDSDKLALQSQTEILTDTRDCNVYRMWVKDPTLAQHHDTIFIDFYENHFKASATDTASRRITCTDIRNFIDGQGSYRNTVVGGDFNFYTSAEAGYQILLSGTYPLRDPLNRPGSWSNNGTFAAIHTQATRSLSSPFYDCGSVGGVDDRFDFMLISDPMLNPANDVFYINNSYFALGNNGSTFNTRINNTTNTSTVPRSVLNSLFYMSDHLPVYMDLGINYPALMAESVLVEWEGQATEQGNRLDWAVEEIADFQYFTLERSTDGQAFSPLAVLPRQAGLQQYQYTDTQPLSEWMYYRLRMDGQQSPVLALDNPHPLEWQFYPNPLREELTIFVPQSVHSDPWTVHWYDAWGRLIEERQMVFTQGVNTMPTGQLKTGFYILEIRCSEASHRRILIKD